MNRQKFSLIVIGVAVIIFVALFYQNAKMDYRVEGENIHITWFKGVNIPRKDIKDVEILEDKPKMDKVVGIELFNIREGTYMLEGIGNVRMYAVNINRKLVLIKTGNMTYCVTPQNPEKFKSMLGY